jgi:hypothetical protein
VILNNVFFPKQLLAACLLHIIPRYTFHEYLVLSVGSCILPVHVQLDALENQDSSVRVCITKFDLQCSCSFPVNN